MRAIARHGLAKLGMSDVSQSAGISRGTLYRYFPTREDLMTGVVREEVRRFRERVQEALSDPGSNEQRIQIVLEQAAQHIREHAPLQRMLETDPGSCSRPCARSSPPSARGCTSCWPRCCARPKRVGPASCVRTSSSIGPRAC